MRSIQSSKCFLPNKRASMDHAPGPIIARVAPSVAKMMGSHGSRAWKKTTKISTIATSVPNSGVHKPMRRNIPAPPATKCRMICAGRAASPRWRIPHSRRTMANSTRCSRSPLPGQPSANVENKRCNCALWRAHRLSLRVDGYVACLKPLFSGFRYQLFGGVDGVGSSIIPRLSPIVTA